METLYKREEFAPADASESVVNIPARYSTVEDLFPGELKGWWGPKNSRCERPKMPHDCGAKACSGWLDPPTTAYDVRRAKAALSSGCKSHPATAPAGSNRSSHGGNEVAEAFD